MQKYIFLRLKGKMELKLYLQNKPAKTKSDRLTQYY